MSGSPRRGPPPPHTNSTNQDVKPGIYDPHRPPSPYGMPINSPALHIPSPAPFGSAPTMSSMPPQTSAMPAYRSTPPRTHSLPQTVVVPSQNREATLSQLHANKMSITPVNMNCSYQQNVQPLSSMPAHAMPVCAPILQQGYPQSPQTWGRFNSPCRGGDSPVVPITHLSNHGPLQTVIPLTPVSTFPPPPPGMGNGMVNNGMLGPMANGFGPGTMGGGSGPGPAGTGGLTVNPAGGAGVVSGGLPGGALMNNQGSQGFGESPTAFVASLAGGTSPVASNMPLLPVVGEGGLAQGDLQAAYEMYTREKRKAEHMKREALSVKEAREMEFLRQHRELENIKMQQALDLAQLESKKRECEQQIERLKLSMKQSEDSLDRIKRERYQSREKEGVFCASLNQRLTELENQRENARLLELEDIRRKMRNQTAKATALSNEKMFVIAGQQENKLIHMDGELNLRLKEQEITAKERQLNRFWDEIEKRRVALEEEHHAEITRRQRQHLVGVKDISLNSTRA